MLVGTFLITFGMLSVMWLTMAGNPDGKAAASPSHVPSPAPAAAAAAASTVSPAPTHGRPHASPTPSVVPSPTATAGATSSQPAAAPSAASSSTPSAANTSTHFVTGGDYVTSQVPNGGSVEAAGQGVVVQAPRTGTLATSVTYQLDSAQLPVGALVLRAEVLVCGGVSGGSTYEIDGPSGVSQTILSSVAPESDGCWHLESVAPSDLQVQVKATLGSRISVTTVEYMVTTDR
jgi:hypothetical protein